MLDLKNIRAGEGRGKSENASPTSNTKSDSLTFSEKGAGGRDTKTPNFTSLSDVSIKTSDISHKL